MFLFAKVVVAMYIKENGKLQYHWKWSVKKTESCQKDNGKLRYFRKSQVIPTENSSIPGKDRY